MFCQLAIVKRLGAAGAVCASAVLCAGATADTATVRLRVFEHDGERAHGLQIVLEHPHAWRMPEMKK